MIALQGYQEVVVWDPYESLDDGMSVKLDSNLNESLDDGMSVKLDSHLTWL